MQGSCSSLKNVFLENAKTHGVCLCFLSQLFYMQSIDDINILQKISDCKQERRIKVCYFIIRFFTEKQVENGRIMLNFRTFIFENLGSAMI